MSHLLDRNKLAFIDFEINT